MTTTLRAPFDLSAVDESLARYHKARERQQFFLDNPSAPPEYTKDNRDEYNNHYYAIIRIGGKRFSWASYDADHLQARIDRAGYTHFVSCFTIEDADRKLPAHKR